MNPPRSVKVGPHRYTIRKHPMVAAADCVGCLDRDSLVIMYDEDLAASQAADTLIHEILHACFCSLKIPEEDEERIILAISPQLLSVLRDNPALVDYLCE